MFLCADDNLKERSALAGNAAVRKRCADGIDRPGRWLRARSVHALSDCSLIQQRAGSLTAVALRFSANRTCFLEKALSEGYLSSWFDV